MNTPRKIPITDLGLEFDAIRQEAMPLLEKILKSGAYVLGPELSAFESDLAKYTGAAHAIGVNSGTDAILLALRALNIRAGDEVIVPAMSFFATVEPIALLDAIPVFVDIDAATHTIDLAKASKAITKKTKALIAVHLYGFPADLAGLGKLCQEKQIALIEDMAQAIGSRFGDRRIGSFGDVAALSFYPTKNLGACGDAGAVLSSSPEIAERVRNLRNHGAKIKYQHEEIAYNSRLDDIQAALLRLKLKHLDSWNLRRKALATVYTKALRGLSLTLPAEVPGREHVYHLYSVQTPKRDQLRDFLHEAGISTGTHYPIPLHLLPALRGLGHKVNDFPNAEKLANQVLSLPLYAFMKDEDAAYVSDHIKRFFAAHA